MNSRLESFYGYLKGKRVAMLGVGRSNTPLVKLFLSKGAKVFVCDRRERAQLSAVADELEDAGAALRLGNGYLDDLDVDVILRTPGMYYYHPALTAARKRGIAVTSEMELFLDLCPCKVIAVTGSDGKTTTTTVISEMLKKQGYRVHLGGNIGRALLPEIENIRPTDRAAVELSSFQLISVRTSPDVAVVTNVAPNHLDVHKNMEEYIAAKKNILLHQNGFGRAVLNLDNAVTAAMADDVRGSLFFFSRLRPVEFGCFADENGVIRLRDGKGEHVVMDTADIRILGAHNIENYLAAVSAVWGDVSTENMAEVARAFPGVEHRIEFVRELGGVKYYNDSMATSPSRTIAGLDSFDRKVILIAGGYDKKIPFDVLGPKIVEKVKYLILLGQTADKIERVVRSAPGYSADALPIIRAESLEQAVKTARGAAEKGDIVTLSPACASFGMFKDFEQRGEMFKKIVRALN